MNELPFPVTFDERVTLRESSDWATLSVLINKVPIPNETPLDIRADTRGIFVSGTLLVVQGDIRAAHVREACERHEVTLANGRRLFTMPAQPFVVELTTSERTWPLAVDDLSQATRLLAALGFPLLVVPISYLTPIRTRKDRLLQRRFAIFLAVGVALAIVASCCVSLLVGAC